MCMGVDSVGLNYLMWLEHPIVSDLLHRYNDFDISDDIEQEVTLSKKLKKPTYEIPKFGYWRKKLNKGPEKDRLIQYFFHFRYDKTRKYYE